MIGFTQYLHNKIYNKINKIIIKNNYCSQLINYFKIGKKMILLNNLL